MNRLPLLRFAVMAFVLLGLLVMHSTGSLASNTCAMGTVTSVTASAASPNPMATHNVAECVSLMPKGVRMMVIGATAVAVVFMFGLFDLSGLRISTHRLLARGRPPDLHALCISRT
jgi:hypothetical protein